MGFVSVVKAGKLANGFELDKGKVVHVVRLYKEESAYTQKALCGAMPKIQWSDRGTQEPTCKKCTQIVKDKVF